jgi:hypothetical protein
MAGRACRVLHVAHSVLRVARCAFCVACRAFFAACCTLCVACCASRSNMRRCTVGASAPTQDATRRLVAGGSRRTARMRWRSWARTTAARSSGRSLLYVCRYACMHACMYSGKSCRDLLRARARLCAAPGAKSLRGTLRTRPGSAGAEPSGISTRPFGRMRSS